MFPLGFLLSQAIRIFRSTEEGAGNPNLGPRLIRLRVYGGPSKSDFGTIEAYKKEEPEMLLATGGDGVLAG